MTAASATAGMRHQRVLELDRRDPLAARLDHVLRAVLDLDVAARMERHDVAGLEPAVLGPAFRLVGRVEVAARDPRAADLELAHRLAVPRQDVPVDVAVAQLDERQRDSLHRDVVEPRVVIRFVQVAEKLRGRCDRRRFGHPPAVDDVEAVPLLEPGNHRPRRRRPADEHPLQAREIPAVGLGVEHREDAHPDRRHARRPRHALLHERVEQALRIEVRTRVHELRADHRCEIRVAPRVRMEHRHDGQDRVGLGDTEPHRVAGCNAERVQHRRAVRVEDALRHPGRAARVTHGRRLVLVELGVAPRVRIGAREQLLVAVLDDDHVLDLRAVDEQVEQRLEAPVDDHGAVAGMRRDVREIVRVQSQVERVQDEAAARDAEIRLVMLVVVPAERRDAVAALEPEPLQRDRERARATARRRRMCSGGSSCRAAA